MKDNYDFSKAVKNPYAEKLKEGYTVKVHYGFAEKGKNEDETNEKKTADKKSQIHA